MLVLVAFSAALGVLGYWNRPLRNTVLTLHRQISVCHIQSISSGVIFCDAPGTSDDSWVKDHGSAHDKNCFCFHRCSDFCRTEHFFKAHAFKASWVVCWFLGVFFLKHIFDLIIMIKNYYFVIIELNSFLSIINLKHFKCSLLSMF